MLTDPLKNAQPRQFRRINRGCDAVRIAILALLVSFVTVECSAGWRAYPFPACNPIRGYRKAPQKRAPYPPKKPLPTTGYPYRKRVEGIIRQDRLKYPDHALQIDYILRRLAEAKDMPAWRRELATYKQWRRSFR